MIIIWPLQVYGGIQLTNLFHVALRLFFRSFQERQKQTGSEMKGLILIRLTANLNYMFLPKCLLSFILFFTRSPEALSQRLVKLEIRLY